VRERKVGVTVAAPLWRAYKRESPLGNLVADLMRAASPGADVAITNGGGVRADFPAGALTYGDLFQTLPFDNRLTTIPITAGELASAVAQNLQRDNGILSLSGAQATARCQGGVLFVSLTDTDGRALAPDRKLTLVTSEFLATGGDGLFPAEVLSRAVVQGERPIRDAAADLLAHRPQPLRPDDPTLFDPAHPRLSYTGTRPVRCD
jgi:5'-nucleotidase